MGLLEQTYAYVCTLKPELIDSLYSTAEKARKAHENQATNQAAQTIGPQGKHLSHRDTNEKNITMTEQGSDHKTHSTYVECEIWGKHAEEASDLEPGQLALFEGKLAKRKKGDQWELIVSGYDVTPVLPAPATLTGNPN
jgi:hypothetical protein